MTQQEDSFGIDFDGAAATRRDILQALQGQLDEDVLQALQQPGTPDWLLAQPFQVVQHLEELQGPADGPAADLPAARNWPNMGHASEQPDMTNLYRQILMYGTADDQRTALHAEQLVTLWNAIRPGVPTAITQVWEQRFPQLNSIRR